MEPRLQYSRLRMKTGAITTLLLFVALSSCVSAALAQSNTQADAGGQGLERGHELEVWTGAGGDPIGTPGITLGNGMWNLGVRYGWVLTDAHGPGFLRGRFEYAVDAIPALVVFQPGRNAFGVGIDPWIMKWNFESHRRFAPYIEIGGGVLFSTREIPAGANKFNFIPSGAIGVHLLRGKYLWSIDLRYFHISDAQITPFNPGTDTFGIRIGWGTFTPTN